MVLLIHLDSPPILVTYIYEEIRTHNAILHKIGNNLLIITFCFYSTYQFCALCVSPAFLCWRRQGRTRTRNERLIQLVSLPLWINGRDRSRNQSLLRRDAKILHKKMLPFVTLLIKMFATYHSILRWSSPVSPSEFNKTSPCSPLTFILGKGMHRYIVRLPLTASCYYTHTSLAFPTHFNDKNLSISSKCLHSK